MAWTLMLALLVAVPAAAATGSELQPLAWMAGGWIGEEHGAVMEEVWMAPRGSVMPGLHRDLLPGGKTSFEFLRIEATPDGLVYIASPRGGPATTFPLKSTGERRVVFENLQHDHPQRILYWLDDAGDLHARIESDRDGRPRSSEWVWKPAPR